MPLNKPSNSPDKGVKGWIINRFKKPLGGGPDPLEVVREMLLSRGEGSERKASAVVWDPDKMGGGWARELSFPWERLPDPDSSALIGIKGVDQKGQEIYYEYYDREAVVALRYNPAIPSISSEQPGRQRESDDLWELVFFTGGKMEAFLLSLSGGKGEQSFLSAAQLDTSWFYAALGSSFFRDEQRLIIPATQIAAVRIPMTRSVDLNPAKSPERRSIRVALRDGTILEGWTTMVEGSTKGVLMLNLSTQSPPSLAGLVYIPYDAILSVEKREPDTHPHPKSDDQYKWRPTTNSGWERCKFQMPQRKDPFLRGVTPEGTPIRISSPQAPILVFSEQAIQEIAREGDLNYALELAKYQNPYEVVLDTGDLLTVYARAERTTFLDGVLGREDEFTTPLAVDGTEIGAQEHRYLAVLPAGRINYVNIGEDVLFAQRESSEEIRTINIRFKNGDIITGETTTAEIGFLEEGKGFFMWIKEEKGWTRIFIPAGAFIKAVVKDPFKGRGKK